MDINEQTDALLFELQNTVNRFHTEFDINHATIVGCLELAKIDYLTEPSEDVEFEADDDDDETASF
tara:strand:+ start:2288 stop:2485 length:198 start_codon:yes stop_codon:yes gene_type:complete